MPPELMQILTAAGPVGVFMVMIIRGDLRLNRELDAANRVIDDLTKKNDAMFQMLIQTQGVAGRAVNTLVDTTNKG